MCPILSAILMGGLSFAAPPASPNQSGLIPVSVTDPLHRFVTGLVEENFVILENGIPRPVTYFSNVDSPISLAWISQSPLALDDNLRRAGDELIQTTSLSDALRQLAASKNSRKAVILTTAGEMRDVPAGIQVLQIDPANAFKAIVELRNQYLLRFQPSESAGRVEIVLKPPRGMPVLKPIWKAPF